MKKELNIAAILKGKPIGTKLWSPAFGDCELLGVSDYAEPIQVTTKSGDFCFRKNGKYAEEGEICLFPSKRINTWSRFTWKKGDVLQISDIGFCTFEKWTSDDYTTFKGRYGVNLGKNSDGYYIAKEDLNTFLWCKVDDDNLIKQYLDEVEKQLGGKLNLETLEIEQPKPEFKDGDILHCNETKYSVEHIFIAKMHGEAIGSYAFLVTHNYKLYIKDTDYDESELSEIRSATDSEKQQLFDALAKKNKRWNPDTKQIEDLPKKCDVKAFDKVLARFDEDCEWMPDFFYYYDKTCSEMPYVCIANGRAIECIPYNEETKHLLGTTDDWEGGKL